MRTAVLFSSHFYRQRRRGGFHWIARGLRDLGWQVRFITVDFSLITMLMGDRRTRYGEALGINRLERQPDGMETAVLRTLTHPLGSGDTALDMALRLVTAGYPGSAIKLVLQWTSDADLILFESNASLAFVPAIRAATDATLIYRVSDNLSVIRPVPFLLEAEARAVGLVDLVSLASPILARQFEGRGRVRIDPMGLDKDQFDSASTSPYPVDGRLRIVCSGTSGLDALTFETAAKWMPELEFVLIGDTPHRFVPSNIRATGELAFADVVPLVKYADIGFAPYLVRPGFEYQAEHSNRLLQYTYSRLPSVVPEALCSSARKHFFGYHAGDADSIVKAFQAAHQFDRARIPHGEVLSWRELAERLAATGKAT